jgi:hypothetical protein
MKAPPPTGNKGHRDPAPEPWPQQAGAANPEGDTGGAAGRVTARLPSRLDGTAVVRIGEAHASRSSERMRLYRRPLAGPNHDTLLWPHPDSWRRVLLPAAPASGCGLDAADAARDSEESEPRRLLARAWDLRPRLAADWWRRHARWVRQLERQLAAGDRRWVRYDAARLVDERAWEAAQQLARDPCCGARVTVIAEELIALAATASAAADDVEAPEAPESRAGQRSGTAAK